jgi:hypothetical protein
MHIYEVRPRKDHRGVELISDALPFGRLWYYGPNATGNAIKFAKFNSCSHDALIRVYDAAGNVIEAHDNAKEFKEWCLDAKIFASKCESSFFFGPPRKSLACNNVTDKWFF